MKRLKDFITENKDTKSMVYLKKFENWNEDDSYSEEEEHDAYYDDEPSTTDEVAEKWYELLDNDFFLEFLEKYPSKEEFEERLYNYKNMMNEEEAEVYMLETEFKNSFPGEEEWNEFCSELSNVGW
jgi:hypothetical protein